jgi:hypothetical membrane protein
MMASQSVPRRAWVIAGVVLISATMQYFLAQVIATGGWTGSVYSWNRNYISELGNTACGNFTLAGSTYPVCSPLHAVMNGSFIVAGILTVLGTILVWRLWPATRLARVGLVLWLIAGVGKIAVGLVPENTDISVHTAGAMNLPIGSVAILLLSLSVRHSHRVLYRLGRMTSLVGLVTGVLFTIAEYSGHSFIPGLEAGGLERLAGYPGNFWILGVGLLAISRRTVGGLGYRAAAKAAAV